MKYLLALIAALVLVQPSIAHADEGMWTFDNFPSAAVAKAYGFSPSHAWLDHVSKAAVRIPGCTASFVSSNGLVMTNHHCVDGCLVSFSSSQHDYSADGFYAATLADERTCPGFEVDQLTKISNVTKTVLAATAGKSGAAFTAASRAINAQLQKSCSNDTTRCDVVSLYHGGIYDLYTYRRYRDVRLVFAPEFLVAQFGGDPDNFNYPRYDFDVSFLRAYDGGKPAQITDYFRFSPNGSKAGELVFVPGNPGGTDRQLTVSQLEYERAVDLPTAMNRIAEMRGLYEEYMTKGTEETRIAYDPLFYLDNTYKVIWGREQALNDEAFFAKLKANEDFLRAKVMANPQLRAKYGNAWTKMAALQAVRERMSLDADYKTGDSIGTKYFGIARTLVRLPVEKAKPNAQRLPEFSDAALVTISDRILDPTPIYPTFEEMKLAYALDDLRRQYGPDDPFVKSVLDGRSPADEAHYLVTNTKLGDVAYRKSLLEGGQAAIDASSDPFILLAKRIDAPSRAMRAKYEDAVVNPMRQLSEEIAKARFAVLGTSTYPDATFTLRLSYGAVKGFTDAHGTAPPYTTIGGLFDRASGADPYILPKSWLDAKSSLDLSTPMNLSTTNDIIGGNSGSPLIDKNAQIVGLIFDGNIHSLGGDYGYDPVLNRSVAVDSRAILEGLRKVYHADRIADELTPH